MTSEVCIMNRLAAVLAADSATTVTSWNGAQREERYFKGANKIFQLSNSHPVGLMIYDAASLLNVPWEVIIKDFRRDLGDKSFDSIEDYADDFQNFVSRSQHLVPDEQRKKQFGELVQSVTAGELAKAAEVHGGDKVNQALAEQAEGFSLDRDRTPLGTEEIDDLISENQEQAGEALLSWASVLQIDVEEPSDTVKRFLVGKTVASAPDIAPRTGLVFAGFGDKDVFPKLTHLEATTFWGTHFHVGKKTNDGVSYETPTVLRSFAQSSMTNMFSLGMSNDVFAVAIGAIEEAIGEVCGQVEHNTGTKLDPAERIKLLSAAKERAADTLLEHAMQEHGFPLRRVIGFLPIDEMAELAETLINLQSLKEKVTSPTETVGGPVDVAVITRSEGLVWIRRKHFFDPSINSRYFTRKSGE